MKGRIVLGTDTEKSQKRFIGEMDRLYRQCQQRNCASLVRYQMGARELSIECYVTAGGIALKPWVEANSTLAVDTRTAKTTINATFNNIQSQTGFDLGEEVEIK
ncbi:MAG: hypothetical protein WC533_03100 [Candidatus Pacearchaeota archaeon]